MSDNETGGAAAVKPNLGSPMNRPQPIMPEITTRPKGESIMRKTIIALFALAAVGLVQPTVASARGGGGGGGHGGGGGGHGGGFHGGGGGGWHGGGGGWGGGGMRAAAIGGGMRPAMAPMR